MAPATAGISGQLLVKREQRRVPARHRLAAEPVEQVRSPLTQVGDPRRHSLGMQGQPEDVGGRLEQVLGGALDEQRHRTVAGHEAPVAIHHHRRERLVSAQKAVDRLAHRTHLGIGEVALTVRRRVARGQEQRVAVAERDVEVLGQLHDHLGARARAAGFDEAHVTRGHPRAQRQVELAHAAALAPVAEQGTDLRPLG